MTSEAGPEFLNNSFDNSSNDSSDNLYPIPIIIPITIVYGLIFITGVVGNVSTCIVIFHNKSMHTATNYYLFSLAVSDMLLLVAGMPAEINRIWAPQTYYFGDIICVLQGFAAETSANATVLTITAFTVERYLAICYPFVSHTMSKLSRVIKYIQAIWLLALFLAIPQAIQFGVIYGKGTAECTVRNQFEYAFEISTFLFFVGPMTVITVLYVLIGRQLRKSKNVAGAHRPSLSNNANGESRRRILRHAAAQNRVVRMLIAVVGAFFICWAPFHAQRLFAIYLNNASESARTSYYTFYMILMYTSGVLYFLSTTINPVLYSIMSHKFRKSFKKTFNCRKTKSAHQTYQTLTRLAPPHQRVFQRSVSEGVEQVQNHKNHAASVSGIGLKEEDFLGNRLKPTPSSDSSKSSESSSDGRSRFLLRKNQEAEHDILMSIFTGKFFRRFRGQTGSFVESPLANTQVTKVIKQDSVNSVHTISNSSLQDLNDTEFTSLDLMKYMQEVNDAL